MASSTRSLYARSALLLAAVILSASPQRANGASSEDAQHLYNVVVSAVGDAELTTGASGALRSLIDSGLQKYPEAKMSQRENVAEKFGGEMAKNAHFDESAGKKIVDLDSFKTADAAVCPLYPFC